MLRALCAEHRQRPGPRAAGPMRGPASHTCHQR